MKRWFVLLGVVVVASIFPAANSSAAAPEVHETWVEGVSADSADLRARLDGGGLVSAYRFDYISESAYQANLQVGSDGFLGAARVPEPQDNDNPGKGDNKVGQRVTHLQPDTAYRYRVVISNADGTAIGPERILRTKALTGPQGLLDARGWEMVSPVDKNGGEIQAPGAGSKGGVFQASAQGGAVVFSSVSSFGVGAGGAPASSQYVVRRGGEGWVTENVTAPASSGSGEEAGETSYQLFSPELSLGLLSAPSSLPLPGTDAPAGYRNYYLRDSSGLYSAFLTHADVAGLALPPGSFELRFVGASPDLGHAVFSTCAALTEDATEVPGTGEGCDSAAPNLYERSSLGWRLLNVLPGDSVGTPPAQLAAFPGAISDDGSRIFWTDEANLYLSVAGDTAVQVDEGVGGGGTFQVASADGSVAFFTKAGSLYRYDVATAATTNLTPAGGVIGVLGVSADGSSVYFLTSAGLFLARGGASTKVAASADPSNFPPSVGTARISAAGDRLAFISSAELTPYDNTETASGKPVAEVYLYDAPRATLSCVSCNPTGARPSGPSGLPGTVASGQGKNAIGTYRPRALSTDGNRLFFDSRDALISGDTNNDWDVYEWEASGFGTCARRQGCVQLISSGRSIGGARFVDASPDGNDAFFLTDGSLVPSDPGSVDLYDARVGGGFPQSPNPIPCEEDACQPLPSPPDDPSPGTLAAGTGNPPAHFPKTKKKKHQKKKHRKRRSRR